jgi:hypothetical protein
MGKMVSHLFKKNKRNYEKGSKILFGNGCVKAMG